MNSELQEKVDEWLELDQVIITFQKKCKKIIILFYNAQLKNPITRDEIKKLLIENKYDDLKTRLLKRMEFGTAGLRAKMGAGYSMMNNLTIIQTGEGFLAYLQNYFGHQKLSEFGISIGYDARHNSKTFAYLTANIFLNAGVLVYLFRQIVPTPFVVNINFYVF